MRRSLVVIALLAFMTFHSGAFAADSATAMTENMQGMQKMMDEIKTEKDPGKRSALMMQHMEAMHKGMEMMTPPQSASSGMDIGNRMEGMEKRMEMMQMMMGQMMQHEEAEMADPAHDHAH